MGGTREGGSIARRVLMPYLGILLGCQSCKCNWISLVSWWCSIENRLHKIAYETQSFECIPPLYGQCDFLSSNIMDNLISSRKEISTLVKLGLCWSVGKIPWTPSWLMWGSLCSCSWPLMSLRAGTMRRILRWWGRRRVLDLEEHWIPTSKKSFSFIVRGCLTQIMNASTQFNHILWRSYPCSCLGRENLVRIHIISIFMRAFNVVTHSHQRHHIQPEGTKALHQAAGMLAPD